jgi:DNA adenine methylase
MKPLSPLRYPGGKARLAPFITRLLREQRPTLHEYAEPFAGGAGVALSLLLNEEVRFIRINDLDPGIAAFWREVFLNTDRLIDRVSETPVDMTTWQWARQTYESKKEADDFDLGFATFFLNRCNHSGILTARPIGGLEQNGRWKMDARFNKGNLIERIATLGRYRNKVGLAELDARDFLKQLEADANRLFVYVDPPYLGQGDALYMNSLGADDHRTLAEQLVASRLRWVLSYDAHSRVTDELYKNLLTAQFGIAHFAHRQHIGQEYFVFSKGVRTHSLDGLSEHGTSWVGGHAVVS